LREEGFQARVGGIAFAPIGPKAKAAVLYFRHELKLPCLKVKAAMDKLVGLEFVPSREPSEAFAFERLGGAHQNHHAERSLRSLVFFLRKVCPGTLRRTNG
jgi:hypothetical protein